MLVNKNGIGNDFVDVHNSLQAKSTKSKSNQTLPNDKQQPNNNEYKKKYKYYNWN